jgi:uncharacterized protein (DUF2147 family)
MNKTLLLSLTTALAIASATADAQQSPATTGSLAVAANRIVGLWDTQPSIKPCGSPLPATPTGHTTLLFNAGGTWIENPRFPPDGIVVDGSVQKRSGGLGTWSYDPLTARYTAHMRFDWYVDGIYSGYQTVDRTILLNSTGNLASGPVRSTNHAADGSVIVELCGSAVGTRL